MFTVINDNGQQIASYAHNSELNTFLLASYPIDNFDYIGPDVAGVMKIRNAQNVIVATVYGPPKPVEGGEG